MYGCRDVVLYSVRADGWEATLSIRGPHAPFPKASGACQILRIVSRPGETLYFISRTIPPVCAVRQFDAIEEAWQRGDILSELWKIAKIKTPYCLP
jgi:hypothetical protein